MIEDIEKLGIMCSQVTFFLGLFFSD